MPTVVTVDASHLGGASANRGIGTYLRNVLGHLAMETNLRIRALVRDRSTLPGNVEAVRILRPGPARFARRQHALLLPIDLRRARCDVVWSPAQDPPRSSPAPVVQTLHDATPLVWAHPDLAADAEHMRRMIPRYRRAAAFVANSAYTADSCARLLGLPRDRIAVAHLAADRRFVPHADRPGRPGGSDGVPYVLYVGEYGAHKGFAEAMAVVAALADAGLPHRLRMVGRIAPQWARRVHQLRAEAPRPDLVDLVGYRDDLAVEYQGASALAMTSRHEGFGLPVVEAMACATPVVSFANSSLIEVVGAGGDLVPDGDVAALATHLVGLLGDTAAWDDASARALDRSSLFDWATSAGIHADVLRAAAAG